MGELLDCVLNLSPDIEPKLPLIQEYHRRVGHEIQNAIGDYENYILVNNYHTYPAFGSVFVKAASPIGASSGYGVQIPEPVNQARVEGYYNIFMFGDNGDIDGLKTAYGDAPEIASILRPVLRFTSGNYRWNSWSFQITNGENARNIPR